MIHHTETFEFETDSLEDFERMLECIVHTLFRHQNSEYTKLHLAHKPPSYWGDGSEYKWSDKAMIEAGGKIYTIEPCATYGGATKYRTVNQHLNFDEAAKEASRCDKLPPTRLWVATLSDSSCRFEKGKDHYCTTKSQMINRAAHMMQQADRDKKAEFEKLRTPEWMDKGDGTVRMGYRIAKEWESGSEVLYLSLCHVYYGK